MPTLPNTRATKALGGGRILIDEAESGLIHAQLTGYWFTARSEVPHVRPAFDPNGALLLDADEACAIVLIDFDGVWLPLSKAAESLYSGPRAVKEGGTAWFAVPGPRGTRTWPAMLIEIRAAPYLTRWRVAELYGDIAGRRARPDKKTVQVCVQRLP